MKRIRPDVDVIMDVLKAVVEAKPGSGFAQSLLLQYQERGGLSKRQLEGLLGIAKKLDGIQPAKLATLEAIIRSKPLKTRSPLPPPAPLYEKDEATRQLIEAILRKYPAHKRVLFFQAKYSNSEPLTPADIAELQRFAKLLK